MNLQFYTNLGLISLCAQFAVKNGPVSEKTIKSIIARRGILAVQINGQHRATCKIAL